MTELLAQIQDTPWIAELLASRFDFDLSRTEPVEDVHLADGQTLTPFAGDAGGGTYLLTPSGSVVYAGSEGEGGLIAHTLKDTLALVVGLPSLHDALSGPLDDDLLARLTEADEEIREQDREDADPSWPDLDESRVRLRDALDLPAAESLLAGLHAAAADEAYRPISEHGRYDPMLSEPE